tara:strand:- start:718 stop:879 length:162 start_codon:yes stop_codon:yes gene_type:complete
MTLTKKEYEDLLTELVSLCLEEVFTLDEVKQAISKFKSNKVVVKLPKSTGVAQ